MKKLFLIALAVLLGIGGMRSQNLPANVNANLLSRLSPVPGEISLDINESGLMSLSFNIAEPNSKFNTGANVYCTLSRDGVVLSNVQACNYVQITYDSIYMDIWALSFFTERNPQVKVAGNYQVKFDEGFFLLGADETPSPEIILNYYIKGDDYYVVPEPEYKKQWTSLQEFTITYPGAERISVSESAVMEIFNVYGGTEDENDTTQGLNYRVEGNSIILYSDAPITAPGTYHMNVRKESLTIYYPNGSEKTNKDITCIYWIPNHAGGLPELDPEPGEIEYFPGTIHVQLQDGVKLLFVNNMGWYYIYPVDSEGNLGNYVARYRAGNTDKDNKCFDLIYYNETTKKFDPEMEFTPAPGDYVLVTPDGGYRIKVNDQDVFVSQMSFNYTVYVYDELPCTVTPESGTVVNDIKKITFEFEEDKEVSVKASIRSSASWLTDGVTNYLFNPVVDQNTPNIVTFNTPVLATLPGTYKFTSGPGQVEINGKGYILTADYTISGATGMGELSNVVILPEIFDIYNPQGIMLKKNADVNYLRTLPAGIYIAGGKKYVVK